MKYVLSDIHGNIKRYENIISQIALSTDDELYVLGDVIDRHPYGIDILRGIMKDPNIHMVLGNHEWMMLRALGMPYPDADENDDIIDIDELLLHWYMNGGKPTHRAFKKLSTSDQYDIIDYLRNLPISVDLEIEDKKYHLVHAAPEELYGTFGNEDSLICYSIWNRDWIQLGGVPENFTVYGHTPTAMMAPDKRELEVLFGCNSIGIDCGSGFPNLSKNDEYIGRLACLRLDDMREFYSQNVITNNKRIIVVC